MEDVGVMKDQHFQCHAKDETGKNYQNARADVMHAPMEDREEMFLILRATRGKGYLQAGGAAVTSRNKGCPCGSGSKFMKCCGRDWGFCLNKD